MLKFQEQYEHTLTKWKCVKTVHDYKCLMKVSLDMWWSSEKLILSVKTIVSYYFLIEQQ